MLLGTKKTLYDHIMEALLGDSMTVSQIQDYLKGLSVHASVHGIYKTLRELLAEDIIVKHKTVYAISNVWRDRLLKIVSQDFGFKLQPNEEVSYKFNTIENTDAFWKHMFQDIRNEVKDFPVYHFTPHQYWLMIPSRKQSEEDYYKTYEQEKIYSFNIIGGETIFDNERKRALSSHFNQVTTNSKINFNRRDHLSVIGPYIITTRVSVTLARVTDRLYETCFTEKELQEKLEPEFKKHGSVTMTVEHNLEKAKSMRKKMSADFHIPRELRERFDLF